MNVVVIGAHPDDEMGCLGTLLRCRRRGDRISFITATNGDKGMSDEPDFPHVECARIRDGEMRAVAAAFDGQYRCLGESDEALYDTWETRLKMIEAIRASRAELVFTHFTSDYNLDHTVTSELVFQATLLSQIASVRTESPALSGVPRIFYMDPGPGHGFEATHFVAIDEPDVTRALDILRLHESQMRVARRLLGRDYAEVIRDRLAQTGARVGVAYAEAFRPCLAARRTPVASMLP